MATRHVDTEESLRSNVPCDTTLYIVLSQHCYSSELWHVVTIHIIMVGVICQPNRRMLHENRKVCGFLDFYWVVCSDYIKLNLTVFIWFS